MSGEKNVYEYINAGYKRQGKKAETAKQYFEKNHGVFNGDGQEVDLIFYENGKIYPVEIKKTSSPNMKDIKSFKVLANYFPSVEMREGGVICNSENLLPLGQGNKVIPLNYI